MFSKLLASNPYILLVVGAAAGWLKNFWTVLYDDTFGYLFKKCQVALTIEESENPDAYIWVNLWIEKYLQKKKITSLRLKRNPRTSKTDEIENDADFSLIPHYGTYYIWYKHRYLITFTSEKDKDQQPTETSSLTTNVSRNKWIKLTLWGTRNRQLLYNILEESKLQFLKDNPKHLHYFTHHDSWWESNTLIRRPLETLYLPSDLKTDLLNDVEIFFNSKNKYRSLGIPWRRGWLLKGPAGTGKSSLVQVLASHFQLAIYYVNLSAKDLSISQLMRLFQNIITPCIILIEDVDCVKAARDRIEKDESDEKIKTSDLLNVMDGLLASEERLLIMTTNHPEKLDPAIVRDGRIDRQFEITYAQDTELFEFYSRAKEFYNLPAWNKFRDELPANCTIANAQNVVFKYINQSK